jgi:signal transduction histidine kinase
MHTRRREPAADSVTLPERAPRRSAGGARTGNGRGRPANGRYALREDASQLLVAQDEERRRIARELHDGTASTLVALSLELARLVACVAPGEPRKLAAACASLCEQSLRELRSAAFVLHPPLLEREGLAVALQWLAQGFSTRSGIQVAFRNGAATGARLPPPVELTLYRVVQEALTNVLRHSGSRTAGVVLAMTRTKVRITVSDRGRGAADRAGVRMGVGIASMRERVKGLGGWLKLAFRRTGTEVTVVVPRG